MDPRASTDIAGWTYNWGGVPRPFVHPVTTPGGITVSMDAPDDHPWHHALWFAIKFVNGENFWETFDEFGLIVQVSPPVVTEHGAATTSASSDLEWLRPGGEVVISEHRVMDHTTLGPDADAMDWDTRLTPLVDVVLDRTPFTTWGGYGGLTLRGRPDWHDTVLRLPDGTGRARVLGNRAPWCALDGPIGSHDRADHPGDPEVGVVMMDHPWNPNHPTPWYASTRADTYGSEGWSNFLNAAFLWDGPIEVRAGEELRIRHRFITHDGRWPLERIEAAWRHWTAAGVAT